jgi:N-acetylneuraminate synthase/sialic acid synthase
MNKTIKIEDFAISSDSDCYVIAEIGNNHQGDIATAKELVDAAKLAGANAVKTQRRDNRYLYTKNYYERSYDNEVSFGKTYGAHRESLELSDADFSALQQYCKEVGVTFFSTAFDYHSADFLAELDVPAYKIASGDLKSIPLIVHIAKFGKPLFVSTGGGTLEDVRRMYDAVMPINSHLCILQCTAAYPCPPEMLNLRIIETFMKEFPEATIGLSDHFNGILSAPLAYMLGARVVEKHFTLNHAMKGTDHAFSLEPSGMRKMIRDLKRTRLALGSADKVPDESENAPLIKMGKKLVASTSLPQGHVLTQEDVTFKSPGDGLPPYELGNVLGKSLRAPLSEDENISFEGLS